MNNYIKCIYKGLYKELKSLRKFNKPEIRYSNV